MKEIKKMPELALCKCTHFVCCGFVEFVVLYPLPIHPSSFASIQKCPFHPTQTHAIQPQCQRQWKVHNNKATRNMLHVRQWDRQNTDFLKIIWWLWMEPICQMCKCIGSIVGRSPCRWLKLPGSTPLSISNKL